MGDKPAKKKFKHYPIGYFHIDIAEVRTAEGKLYLFVAIDHTSKFAFVQLVERANTKTASAFLHALVEAVAYRIHTVLTDNGTQYKTWRGKSAFTKLLDRRGIKQIVASPRHPQTLGKICLTALLKLL